MKAILELASRNMDMVLEISKDQLITQNFTGDHEAGANYVMGFIIVGVELLTMVKLRLFCEGWPVNP